MTYIVCELGSNHDGKLEQAIALIDAAAGAGASAAKLQCLSPLQHEWLPKLKQFANSVGIGLFATPFDVDAVQELADLGVPYIKIASTELVYDELIEAAAATRLPLVLSTGGASMSEIKRALEIVSHAEPATPRLAIPNQTQRYHALPNPARLNVILLQCVVRYPAPSEQTNLRAMETMRDVFELPVGLSDHTTSTTIPAAAVALGAIMVEKHLTLNRASDGPDHAYALEPGEFKAMVAAIREVEVALGDGAKSGPVDGELVEARGRRLRWRDKVS